MTSAVSGPKDRGGAVRRGPTARPLPVLAPRPEPLLNIEEEQQRRARENRLRVAFLATKGNTMTMWLAERTAILDGAAALD